MMTAIKVWLAQAKWILLAIAGFGVAVLLWCLRGLISDNSKPKNPDGGFLPPVPKSLQDAADSAQENALVTKATTKATTDAKKQELETINKISDGKERRKALAAFLQNS